VLCSTYYVIIRGVLRLVYYVMIVYVMIVYVIAEADSITKFSSSSVRYDTLTSCFLVRSSSPRKNTGLGGLVICQFTAKLCSIRKLSGSIPSFRTRLIPSYPHARTASRHLARIPDQAPERFGRKNCYDSGKCNHPSAF